MSSKSPEPGQTLTIELIPETAWGQNLRAVLSRRNWDAVRRFAYRRAGYRCECCGGVGPTHPVECHEVWAWDEAGLVQRLTGVIALCPTCHSVKHWGRTIATAMWPDNAETNLLGHIMRVNGWTYRETQAHKRDVFGWWAVASEFEWTLDVQTYLREAQARGDFTLRDWKGEP